MVQCDLPKGEREPRRIVKKPSMFWQPRRVQQWVEVLEKKLEILIQSQRSDEFGIV